VEATGVKERGGHSQQWLCPLFLCLRGTLEDGVGIVFICEQYHHSGDGGQSVCRYLAASPIGKWHK